MRKSLGALLIAVGAVTCAGCSGSSTTSTAVTVGPGTGPSAASAAAPAAPSALPAGFHLVSGTAYQFGLPKAVKFAVDKPVVSATGGLAGRWRYQVSPAGPFCVVVASEQARFNDRFPSSVVQSFTTEGQPDQKTLLNKVMTPTPPGTIGGVEQESTFTGTLTSGTKFPSQLYQRKYLTPGGTLITLTVAGPQTGSDRCRMPEIIKTFSATGHEFAGVVPAASPS